MSDNMQEPNYTYLDRNEFNFEPAPAVLEAFRNFDTQKLAFYTRIYDEGKKSIVSTFLAQKYGLPENQILMGYGGEYLLKETVHYYLTRPDGRNTILIPKFSWWYYQSVADEVGGRTIQYPLVEDEDTFRYDFDALKKLIHEERPKLLLLASPNNPTGNILTPDELDHLLDSVPQETVVYIDEAYSSFVNEDDSYVARLVTKHPNLIIARTLSKFYGLPGVRLGFAFTSPGMEAFAKFTNMYLGYNRISEDLALAALKSESYYRSIAHKMAESRELISRELGALPGFKVYKSAANFILVKYPIELKAEMQTALTNQWYKIKFMNEPDINSHVRITLGPVAKSRVVVDTIKEIARKHL